MIAPVVPYQCLLGCLSVYNSDTLYNESSYSNNCPILQLFLVTRIEYSSAVSVGLVGSPVVVLRQSFETTGHRLPRGKRVNPASGWRLTNKDVKVPRRTRQCWVPELHSRSHVQRLTTCDGWLIKTSMSRCVLTQQQGQISKVAWLLLIIGFSYSSIGGILLHRDFYEDLRRGSCFLSRLGSLYGV